MYLWRKWADRFTDPGSPMHLFANMEVDLHMRFECNTCLLTFNLRIEFYRIRAYNCCFLYIVPTLVIICRQKSD